MKISKEIEGLLERNEKEITRLENDREDINRSLTELNSRLAPLYDNRMALQLTQKLLGAQSNGNGKDKSEHQDHSSHDDHPKKKGKLLFAICKVIYERGQPMKNPDILAELEKRNFHFTGKDLGKNISVCLSKYKNDYFEKTGDGYKLLQPAAKLLGVE